MKKETIAKFVAEYKGDDLATALSAFIVDVDGLMQSMRTYYQACADERQRQATEALRLDGMLFAIQTRCCHPEKETCYGPYENYTKCTVCQKELQ